MSFPDVPARHPHRAGIEWAAEQGYVQGRADGTFGPEEPLTRGQLCTILHRMFHQDVDIQAVSAVIAAMSPATVVRYIETEYELPPSL